MRKLVRQDDIRKDRIATRVLHEEWWIDEALRDSFPASDPASTSQPGSIAHARYAEPVGYTD